ncbi:hypothetical protein PoB_001887200 [Plakobranchus ocellatus]|uniref:Uncharacterized protein n=1 Tax=Plakobranchus ocellatus TaxID=259542 RepID=A0AAV3ZD12_9GAST|nr:hypothetical protein PoB_001887200 [Plakobranchus ocellatus]
MSETARIVRFPEIGPKSTEQPADRETQVVKCVHRVQQPPIRTRGAYSLQKIRFSGWEVLREKPAADHVHFLERPSCMRVYLEACWDLLLSIFSCTFNFTLHCENVNTVKAAKQTIAVGAILEFGMCQTADCAKPLYTSYSTPVFWSDGKHR